VFIFSSSCAVYGDSDKILTEESPLAPISPYAQSKIAGETLCKEYSHLGIHAVALRYFNVYGDRQDPSGYYAAVVSKFSYNLEHKLPLIIFGDGTQTRDFVHVSYIVLANLIMGMYPADGDIFNIASGKSINLFQLISYLEKIYGQNTAGINFKPKRAGDILHVTASGEKFLNYVKKIFT
jgi:UDP-glucose 4-epimerase